MFSRILAEANALIPATGWASEETGHAFARAEELCRSVADPRLRFRVVFGNWSFQYLRGDLRSARNYAERCLDLAAQLQDTKLLINAQVATGDTLTLVGEFANARAYLEKSIALYGPGHDPSYVATFSRDPKISALQLLSLTLWCLGYPEQALDRARESSAHADRLSHPFSRAWSCFTLGDLHVHRGETHAAAAPLSQGLALSVEQGFVWFTSMFHASQGSRLIQLEDPRAGEALLRQALAEMRAIGCQWGFSLLLGDLGRALLGSKARDQGLEVVAEGLSLVARNDEHIGEAELHRLKGELLLIGKPSDPSAAEACFFKAIEVARGQEAKSWELRAAMSYARLMMQ